MWLMQSKAMPLGSRSIPANLLFEGALVLFITTSANTNPPSKSTRRLFDLSRMTPVRSDLWFLPTCCLTESRTPQRQPERHVRRGWTLLWVQRFMRSPSTRITLLKWRGRWPLPQAKRAKKTYSWHWTRIQPPTSDILEERVSYRGRLPNQRSRQERRRLRHPTRLWLLCAKACLAIPTEHDN